MCVITMCFMFQFIVESTEESNDAESFQNEESFDPKEIKEDVI